MASPNWMKWLVKPIVFLSCLTPLTILGWEAYSGNLSANPIDDITDATGTWTLRLLLITLSISPARKLTGWNALIQLRRMVGLIAFFYVSLHFLTYIWLDQFFGFEDIVKDVAKRPFITAGFTAFVLLIPLAVTSTKKMVRRLGGRRWNALHKLIYAAAVCGVVHYLWLVKADKERPLLYGAALAVLLGYRVFDYFRKLKQHRKHAPETDAGGTVRPLPAQE
jgi:sulfoxide reductase heme-binding subunit YedZ